MGSVKTLIDMASVKCGTDAELARILGTMPQSLAGMRAGRRPISPETVAALCDVLELSGEEAREWLAVSVIENPKNASCAARLRRALFGCWVVGVAALSAQNDAQARSGDYMGRGDSLYIVAHWWRRWLASFGTSPSLNHR